MTLRQLYPLLQVITRYHSMLSTVYPTLVKAPHVMAAAALELEEQPGADTWQHGINTGVSLKAKPVCLCFGQSRPSGLRLEGMLQQLRQADDINTLLSS